MTTIVTRSHVRSFAHSLKQYAESWDGKSEVALPQYEVTNTASLKGRVEALLGGYKSTEKSRKAVRDQAQACAAAIQALMDKRKEENTSTSVKGKLKKAFTTDSVNQSLQSAKAYAEKVSGEHRTGVKALLAERVTSVATGAVNKFIEVSTSSELTHRLWQCIPRYHANKEKSWWLHYADGWDWLHTYATLSEFNDFGFEGSTQVKSLRVLFQDVDAFVKTKGAGVSPALKKVAAILEKGDKESRKLATARLAGDSWDRYVYDYLYKKQEEIRLLQPGETALIISGCGEGQLSHAIYYGVTCQEIEGIRSLSLAIYNTGDGADRYQTPKKASLPYQAVYFAYDLVTFEGIKPEIFDDYELLRILTGVDVESAAKAQDTLVQKIMANGGEKKFKKAFHPQGIGNCAYEALLLFLADHLSTKEFRELQEYMGNQALNKLDRLANDYVQSLDADKQAPFRTFIEKLKTTSQETHDPEEPSLIKALQAFIIRWIVLPTVYYFLRIANAVGGVFGRPLFPEASVKADV